MWYIYFVFGNCSPKNVGEERKERRQGGREGIRKEEEVWEGGEKKKIKAKPLPAPYLVILREQRASPGEMHYAEDTILSSLLPEHSAKQSLKHSKGTTGLNDSSTLYTTTMETDVYKDGDGKH